MSECQSCTAPAPDAFICTRCSVELRDMLRALAEGPYASPPERIKSGRGCATLQRTPGLIASLTEVALGQVKLGGGGGQRKRGDEIAAPFEPDTENGRYTRQGEAATLLVAVTNGLSTITRDVCESRGIAAPDTDAVGAAAFLAGNSSALALDESAGHWHREVTNYVRRIERVIDRPVPPRFVGPCPTLVTDPDTRRQRECGTRLMAKREATVVHCRECKAEYNVERIINRLLANVEHWRFTREELIGHRTGDWTGIMGLLEEPVSKSTFHRWRKGGQLIPNGFRNRDSGRITISRHAENDEPVYRLSRVRQLRTEMGAKQAQAMGWEKAGA